MSVISNNGNSLGLEKASSLLHTNEKNIFIAEKSSEFRPHRGMLEEKSNLIQDIELYRMARSGYTSSPLLFKSFTNATLVKKYGIVLTQDEKFIEETVSAQKWLDPSLSFMKDALNISKNQLVEISGNALFANHGNYCVYGHFICETALSIFTMRNLIIEKGIKIILPRDNMHYIESILNILQIPKQQRLYLSDSRAYRLENLIISSACSSGVTFHPGRSLMGMSTHFKNLLCNKPVSPNPTRLYLTRDNANTTSKRILKNDQELSERLKLLNFTRIEPSSYTFEDQVRIFSEAEIIVGPHGSAFTNMIFMKPGGFVLDIIPEHWIGPGLNFTSHLSNLADLNYSFLLSKSKEIEGGYENYVDCDLVISKIHKFLNSEFDVN